MWAICSVKIWRWPSKRLFLTSSVKFGVWGVFTSAFENSHSWTLSLFKSKFCKISLMLPIFLSLSGKFYKILPKDCVRGNIWQSYSKIFLCYTKIWPWVISNIHKKVMQKLSRLFSLLRWGCNGDNWLESVEVFDLEERTWSKARLVQNLTIFCHHRTAVKHSLKRWINMHYEICT